jgi:cholesterol transport system auxiliary component
MKNNKSFSRNINYELIKSLLILKFIKNLIYRINFIPKGLSSHKYGTFAHITRIYMQKNFLSIVFILFLSHSFINCFSIKKDFPEKKSFLLELSPSKGQARSMPKEWNVKLRKVSVSSKYLDKSFVYRRSESKYESDFYDEFLISPQQNLSEELVKYLDASGAFLSTSDMNSRIEATHYIEADFTGLYGDFREKGFPKSYMEVQLRVFDDRTAEYTPIFRKNFSKSIPMKDESPESLVDGWNQALAEICNDFIKDSKNWKDIK